MPRQLCCQVSACHTWASHSGFQHALTPLGTKGTTGGLGRKGSFRPIQAQMVPGHLDPSGPLLQAALWGLGGPSLSSLTWSIPATVAHQDPGLRLGTALSAKRPGGWRGRRPGSSRWMLVTVSGRPAQRLHNPAPLQDRSLWQSGWAPSGTAVASPIPGSPLTRPLPSTNTMNSTGQAYQAELGP